MSRYGIFLAARSGSTRLPGKALLPLGGHTMLSFVMKRLKNSCEVSDFVLATTDLPADDRLVEIAQSEGFAVFRGSQDDVVERFVGAARRYPVDYVIRVTADCPFIDGNMIDEGIRSARTHEAFDLFTSKVSNFPIGLDYEIYAAACMEELHRSNKLDAVDREHLTKYLYDHATEFKIYRAQAPQNWKATSQIFTVDTPADYARVSGWIQKISDAVSLPVAEIIDLAKV